jgi:D-arabinose 1-dehydrogenase-like Zn-dependent alcohol dehydrogenase
VTDWDHLTSRNISANSGDDVAGTIYEVGENVKRSGEFHVGDRVAAFHPMFSPGGAYAEYALAPQHTTFKIPDQTSFEGMSNLLNEKPLLSHRRSCNDPTCHHDSGSVALSKPTSSNPLVP